MFLDPLNIERTEWKVKDVKSLFRKVAEPLFPQLTKSDLDEIEFKMDLHDIDYFEVAHYKGSFEERKDPSAILVFQGKRVFYDIVDVNQKDLLVDEFKKLGQEQALFIKSRKITRNELKKRVDALMTEHLRDQIFEQEEFEDDGEDITFDYIPKDAHGCIERCPYMIEAKQPVLDWMLEAEKKEPRSRLPIGKMDWSLAVINKEPTVFLMPVGIELLSKREQKIIWRQAKVKALESFLFEYYTDPSYWPEDLSEELFDQWFNLKQLGIVVDLVDGEDIEADYI